MSKAYLNALAEEGTRQDLIGWLCKHDAEIDKLRGALQRIANLPMKQREGKPDPHLRARRIAVAAIGGDPQKITKR